MIAPTLFKLYEEFAHVLDPLWRNAEQAIRETDELVIIGYSLPPTDSRAATLFRAAIGQDVVPKIVIVNPDAAGVSELGSVPRSLPGIRPRTTEDRAAVQ